MTAGSLKSDGYRFNPFGPLGLKKMLTHGNQFIGNLPNIRALEYSSEQAL